MLIVALAIMTLYYHFMVQLPFSERWKLLEEEVVRPRNYERKQFECEGKCNPIYRYDMEPFSVSRYKMMQLFCNFFQDLYITPCLVDIYVIYLFFSMSCWYIHVIYLFFYLIDQVRRKDFWLLSTVVKLLKEFIPKLSHAADGLIFQVLGHKSLFCNF